MPNFTINRQVISPGDDIGCNEFQTNQLPGNVATINQPNSPLDGDIVWYLDADSGYTVDIGDFDIPATTPTAVAQSSTYRTFEGGSLPSFVNGVVFEQISITRIKITIFLHPTVTHGITGSVFVMPPADVQGQIEIDGCARVRNVSTRLMFVQGGNDVDTEVVVAQQYRTGISQETGYQSEVISGDISQEEEEVELATYRVEAKEGYRFVSPPSLRISTSDYYTQPIATRDDSGNVTSVTFKVIKTI